MTGSPSSVAGTTDYTVAVDDGTPVVLTAPETAGTPARLFDHWSLDGVAQSTGERNLTFTADRDRVAQVAYVAYYVSTVEQLRKRIANAEAGATIYIAPGTHVVTQSIEIARDDITITGQGDATFFSLKEGVHDPVFIIGEPTPFAPTTTHHGIVLRSMRIKGYRFPNQQPGDELSATPGRDFLRNNCVTMRQASDCTVESIKLENAASGGIVLEQTCRSITLKNLESFGNYFDGIAWDGDIQNSRIENCMLRNNSGAGLSFDIGPASNIITGCTIRDNATVGLFIRDSHANTFENCIISGNGQDGVFIADGDRTGAAATDNVFTNNQYSNNARHGIWQAGANSTNNQIQGGTVCGNGDTPIEESFPGTAPLVQTGVTIMTTCP